MPCNRGTGFEREPWLGKNGRVIGPVIMVVTLVVVIPVAVCMSGAVLAWILGWFMKFDAEKRNADSEYIALGQ